MNELGLKQIAFVAMPFYVKPMHLAPGKGPAEIDFHALGDKAIFPALSDLGFMPIRSDNQSGFCNACHTSYQIIVSRESVHRERMEFSDFYALLQIVDSPIT